MVSIQRYEPAHKTLWDAFVASSINGTFLHYRDYVDYHADRFADHSLLFFKRHRLVAILPANVTDDVCISHQGLTFGGIITNRRMRTPLMLEIFDALRVYLRRRGLARLVYKPVPYIYQTLPADADLYALFRHHATLVKRDVSSTVFRSGRPPYSKGKRGSVAKAKRGGLTFRRTEEFRCFMEATERLLLARYDATPTHSADEMIQLAVRFPGHIKLFGAYRDAEWLAGAIIYESARVAHTQYLWCSAGGRALGATDALIDALLTDYYADKPYFDFGTSAAGDGCALNVSLLNSKEGYGGRPVMYDTYELQL